MGQPEIVGTLKPYRRRGLVREQFRILHEWSAERNELVQAIGGISYYYRQFGYEYALTLEGARQTFVPQQLPQKKEGERDDIRLRRATRDDFPFIAQLVELGGERSLVHCNRTVEYIEYQQYGENITPKIGPYCYWTIIETRAGEKLGAFSYKHNTTGGRAKCLYYELLPNVSWADITPAVMRAFAVIGTKLATKEKRALTSLCWQIAENHPLFELFAGATSPWIDPYAWYVRVPDLPAFLNHIAPILEKRLAASNLREHMGALQLNFIKSGIELVFDNGKLTTRAWQPTGIDWGQRGYGNAAFPDLTFLKLVFGYRSLAEVRYMFPDCVVDNDRTRSLLETLFPKQPSYVHPIR